MPLDVNTLARLALKSLERIPKDGVSPLEGFKRSYGVLLDHIRSNLSSSDTCEQLTLTPSANPVHLDSSERDVSVYMDTTGQTGTRVINLPAGFDYQRVTVCDVGNNAANQNIDVGGIYTITSNRGAVSVVKLPSPLGWQIRFTAS